MCMKLDVYVWTPMESRLSSGWAGMLFYILLSRMSVNYECKSWNYAQQIFVTSGC